MRILHVVGALNRGGAETWLVQVMRHIDRQKYQFDFLVHTTEPSAYDNEVRSMGARVIPCLSPFRPATYARNFLRVLREYGPYDVVHSHVHRFSGYVMALATLAGVPQRIAHSHLDASVAEERASVARRCYLLSMKTLLRTLSTRGIAVSRPAASDLFGTRWHACPKFSVSELGIDFEPFLGPLDRMQVRRSLGIREDDFVVGHIGRFEPQKNHDFLIDVAAELVRREPRTLVLLLGDGPLRPLMKSKVRTLGIEQRVRFLGVRKDVPRILRGAMDVFVFPSSYEGFGLALVEAQAAGLPCIASDRCPAEAKVISELVTTLSLREPPSAWASAVLTSADCPKRTFTESPFSNFTIAASVARLCAIYDSGNTHEAVD